MQPNESGELQEMKISWWDEQRYLIGWWIGNQWRRLVLRMKRRG
ncbi:hypothetical protein WMW72_10745 [Paenibacillus filicis]|uniref:Uncharacterized protein n=1 Tax=Paenibacillus filicis TaxID=669464 RepID=A0ABU9DHS4_9BACL